VEETIEELDLFEAQLIYQDCLRKMPDRYADIMPSFLQFLSPANLTNFQQHFIKLSITGTRRYNMLMSPNAYALLMAYAVEMVDDRR
jgi:hypothetical protein